MSDDDDDICPGCGSAAIGVEVRGLYDGILYWRCGRCRHAWHRFPEGHSLRDKAETFMKGKS